jgi:hypothetical protein
MGEMTNVYDVLVNRKKPIGRITLKWILKKVAGMCHEDR